MICLAHTTPQWRKDAKIYNEQCPNSMRFPPFTFPNPSSQSWHIPQPQTDTLTDRHGPLHHRPINNHSVSHHPTQHRSLKSYTETETQQITLSAITSRPSTDTPRRQCFHPGTHGWRWQQDGCLFLSTFHSHIPLNPAAFPILFFGPRVVQMKSVVP